MLGFPLGVLSAAAQVGPVPIISDYELISTAFGTGSSGVITFSSIPQTYKHLQIRYTAKNTSTASTMLVRFNGDTTSNYGSHSLRSDGSAMSFTSSITATSISLFDGMSQSTTGNSFSGGIIDIIDYTSASKNKTLKSIYGSQITPSSLGINSGFLNNTSALTSLTITASSANFTSDSRFSLYGIKG
jgi:hypothetical protein